MDEMIEAIKAAVTEGATVDQRVAGAQACRTIMAALEAEVGRPIGLAGAPAPSPLAGISPDQALDLLIARLSAIAEQRPAPVAATPSKAGPPRIALVQIPSRAGARRKA